jgi:hypothetical protein
MILQNALPKFLGGGQHHEDDENFKGGGSRIPRNLLDLLKDSGEYWLPPIRMGAFNEEFMNMHCIVDAINRKIKQDNIIKNIMNHYLSSILGVGYLCKILIKKINSPANIDRNLDQYFISQIINLKNEPEKPKGSQTKKIDNYKLKLRKSTEFCRKVMMHMQTA